MNELGYNITGVITGLGLSGLTLSLAAKDTVQNMIGGFMIIFDKPFQVGDYIELSGKEGFVENITMRSTRIRTNDGSETVSYTHLDVYKRQRISLSSRSRIFSTETAIP